MQQNQWEWAEPELNKWEKTINLLIQSFLLAHYIKEYMSNSLYKVKVKSSKICSQSIITIKANKIPMMCF